MYKEKKTTKTQYKRYQIAVRRFMRFFGLKSWEIHFKMEKSPDTIATSECDWEARHALFGLSDMMPKGTNIDKTAFHEVLEVFLHKLKSIAEAREFNQETLDAEIHTVIVTLENEVYDLVRKK